MKTEGSRYKRVCGNCARFKVPDSGCTYAKDIREGILTAEDPACDDFFLARRRKEPKEKPAPHLASGVAEEGLFEGIYHDDKPMFLTKTKDGFSVVESVTNQGRKVVPKELGEFPYPPYGYSEHAIPDREDLYWRVRNELDMFVDVDSIWKDYGAACVLLSYQQEKLLTVPYPFLHGDNESGKSSFLGVLGALSYRPLLGTTIPSADVYGYLEDSDSPGVVLEDEAQGLDRDLDKVKIYKAGYAQGAVVPRTFILERKRFIKYFRCFCFKAFAAEKIPAVKGFNERCVFIPMFPGEPKKEWTERDAEDEKRLRELRNVLLKWRLASRLEWSLPQPALPFKARMRELWKPILQVTHGLTVYDQLLNFASRQAQERLSGKQNTLEGHIVKVVSELYVKDEPVPFTGVWDALVKELEGKLDDKKPNKMDTPEFGEVTKQKVGYRLREILSGKSRSYRTREGFTKAYEFNEEQLRRTVKSYGFNIVSKCPSFPTSGGVTVSETMEKDHEIPMQKATETPQELGKLRHLDTNSKLLPGTGVTSSPSISERLTTKTENNAESRTGVDVKTVLAVLALDPVTHGACPLCKKRNVNLIWQVLLIDGSRYDAVCMDCGGGLLEELRKREEVT